MSVEQQITDQELKQAVDLLRRGRLVAFPTETVYGLGADASSEDALRRLYQVKGRPTDHPVIVHLAKVADLGAWTNNIPDAAHKLAEAFWPGPMTLILPKATHVSPLVTGGQDSVGLRIPSHPVALQLIASFGGGIAAPSANRFGRLSPTTAEAVKDSLGDDVDLILDGGPCQVGIESTIISLLDPHSPQILRPGMLDAAAIEAVLGRAMVRSTAQKMRSSDVRVPGALPSHYAPLTPLAVADADNIIEMFGEGAAIGRSQAVIAFAPTIKTIKNSFGQGILSGLEYEALIEAPAQVEPYARLLYDSLRRLDQLALHNILVEVVPADPVWDGVRDRLARASAGR